MANSRRQIQGAFAWAVRITFWQTDLAVQRIIESYNKSQEIDPKNIGAQRDRDKALASLGRYEEAQ